MCVDVKMVLVKFCLLLAVCFSLVDCFNISPIPNIILKRDATKTFQSEKRSPYFGYTVVLRKNSVIIGAPRSKSVLNSQTNIDETGTIYKCDLNGSNVNKKCYPYNFDLSGNKKLNDSFFKTENKEYQMLGASMDGLSTEWNLFIVCAPNLKDVSINLRDNYYIHGICYWVHNTIENEPKNVFQIIDSRKNKHHSYMSNAQQGFSVHITEKTDEFLIGVPGAFLWKGEF